MRRIWESLLKILLNSLITLTNNIFDDIILYKTRRDKGGVSDLKIFTDVIEQEALEQIDTLMSHPAFGECKVRDYAGCLWQVNLRRVPYGI